MNKIFGIAFLIESKLEKNDKINWSKESIYFNALYKNTNISSEKIIKQIQEKLNVYKNTNLK